MRNMSQQYPWIARLGMFECICVFFFWFVLAFSHNIQKWRIILLFFILYLLSLRTVYDGHFHCGASLISSDYVLTAAHCVRRVKRSKIRIILGDHDQTVISDADAKMRAVSAIIKHRHFDANTYNHDIALLKLRKPILYGTNIMPVCLPADDFEPAGKTGIAVGWGECVRVKRISL